MDQHKEICVGESACGRPHSPPPPSFSANDHQQGFSDGILEPEDVMWLMRDKGRPRKKATVTERLGLHFPAAIEQMSHAAHIELHMAHRQQAQQERHMVVAAKTYAEGVSRAAVVRKLVKQVAADQFVQAPNAQPPNPPPDPEPEPKEIPMQRPLPPSQKIGFGSGSTRGAVPMRHTNSMDTGADRGRQTSSLPDSNVPTPKASSAAPPMDTNTSDTTSHPSHGGAAPISPSHSEPAAEVLPSLPPPTQAQPAPEPLPDGAAQQPQPPRRYIGASSLKRPEPIMRRSMPAAAGRVQQLGGVGGMSLNTISLDGWAGGAPNPSQPHSAHGSLTSAQLHGGAPRRGAARPRRTLGPPSQATPAPSLSTLESLYGVGAGGHPSLRASASMPGFGGAATDGLASPLSHGASLSVRAPARTPPSGAGADVGLEWEEGGGSPGATVAVGPWGTVQSSTAEEQEEDMGLLQGAVAAGRAQSASASPQEGGEEKGCSSGSTPTPSGLATNSLSGNGGSRYDAASQGLQGGESSVGDHPQPQQEPALSDTDQPGLVHHTHHGAPYYGHSHHQQSRAPDVPSAPPSPFAAASTTPHAPPVPAPESAQGCVARLHHRHTSSMELGSQTDVGTDSEPPSGSMQGKAGEGSAHADSEPFSADSTLDTRASQAQPGSSAPLQALPSSSSLTTYAPRRLGAPARRAPPNPQPQYGAVHAAAAAPMAVRVGPGPLRVCTGLGDLRAALQAMAAPQGGPMMAPSPPPYARSASVLGSTRSSMEHCTVRPGAGDTRVLLARADSGAPSSGADSPHCRSARGLGADTDPQHSGAGSGPGSTAGSSLEDGWGHSHNGTRSARLPAPNIKPLASHSSVNLLRYVEGDGSESGSPKVRTLSGTGTSAGMLRPSPQLSQLRIGRSYSSSQVAPVAASGDPFAGVSGSGFDRLKASPASATYAPQPSHVGMHPTLQPNLISPTALLPAAVRGGSEHLGLGHTPLLRTASLLAPPGGHVSPVGGGAVQLLLAQGPGSGGSGSKGSPGVARSPAQGRARHLPVHTLTSVGQLEFQVIALPKIGRGGR